MTWQPAKARGLVARTGMIQMSGVTGKAGRARSAFGWAAEMTGTRKTTARSMPGHLMPGTPQPAPAGPAGEGALPARAGPVAGPCPSAPGSSAVVSEDNDAGPPGGSPAGTAGRAARVVRRAMQPAGGGALAAAVTMMTAYGLWQVFRWGGREHQALIGDLAFVPVNGVAAVLAWRASRRAGLGRNTCRAWRLLAIALLL